MLTLRVEYRMVSWNALLVTSQHAAIYIPEAFGRWQKLNLSNILRLEDEGATINGRACLKAKTFKALLQTNWGCIFNERTENFVLEC